MQVIPNFVAIQSQIVNGVLFAAKQAYVQISLARYHDTCRTGLRVANHDNAYKILKLCAAQGLVFGDPQKGEAWTTRQFLQVAPLKTRIWCPIYMHGRIIHGTASGIDLIIERTSEQPLEVTFPDERFSDTWINTSWNQTTYRVDQPLLSRLEALRRPTKVDIVFTWVDGADQAWRAKRQLFDLETPTQDANDPARFMTNDELKYALRGLFRYFDGIGQVYLVTDEQIPSYWDEFSDRVTLVDHSQIMDADVARPTFNSHAIESCLHRIPNLSSHYIYFNDDVILTNPASVADFFDSEGRAQIFYSDKKTIPKDVSGSSVAADCAAYNAKQLLLQTYAHHVWRKFKHCPIATRKDVIEGLEQKFEAIFTMIRNHRFRHQDDFAPAGSLYQHIALMQNDAIAGEISYQYLDITGRKLPFHLMVLAGLPSQLRPIVLCLNAVTGGVGSSLNRSSIAWEMERLLPTDMVKKTMPKTLVKMHHTMLRLRSRILNLLKRKND